MRRLLRGMIANEAGATAVEFAIVCPLIFATVLGTFETGRALYVRNHISEAAAAGARAVITSENDAAAIEAAVRARFKSAQQSLLDVNLTDETFSGADFKKIEVIYNHDFIIHLGDGLSGITLTITRYAPNTT